MYSLDEPERTILIMYFFEKATFKEISEILHIPQSTIKTRYYNIIEISRKMSKFNISNTFCQEKCGIVL